MIFKDVHVRGLADLAELRQHHLNLLTPIIRLQQLPRDVRHRRQNRFTLAQRRLGLSAFRNLLLQLRVGVAQGLGAQLDQRLQLILMLLQFCFGPTALLQQHHTQQRAAQLAAQRTADNRQRRIDFKQDKAQSLFFGV